MTRDSGRNFGFGHPAPKPDKPPRDWFLIVISWGAVLCGCATLAYAVWLAMRMHGYA
jgi:hypothetical protein